MPCLVACPIDSTHRLITSLFALTPNNLKLALTTVYTITAQPCIISRASHVLRHNRHLHFFMLSVTAMFTSTKFISGKKEKKWKELTENRLP